MRRPLLAALTSLAVAAATAIGAAGATAAPEPGPGSSGISRAAATLPKDKVAPALGRAEGQVTAFVQLAAPSAVEVARSGANAAAVHGAATKINALAAAVVPHRVTALTAKESVPQRLSVTTNLVAGTLVTGDAAQIRELAASDRVVAMYRIVPKKVDNLGTDAFTRALDAWTATGATGAGVRIGVIDTGLDYTHADFGGPSTPAAYANAYGTNGTGPIPAGSFDPTKFLGGYDFAGPDYDAEDPTSVPAPDANPIDSGYKGGNEGHGSHVAGTGAGFGVQPDGTTFRGDYGALTNLTNWKVGPGSAPQAGVYALKVFGDAGGSTNLVVDALDWAADPNGDHNFNDHLDVLNMSLGSDFSPADDPENLFVDRATDLGMLSVISAGNGGDITDVGGASANARTALTVAASVGNTQTFDAVEVTAATNPARIGLQPAQNSVDYTGTTDVTAPVAFIGATVSGCTSLADHAAALAGKIAWLWWDDNDATRECGSATRWGNAEAAGAVGVLIGTQAPVFTSGIAGSATLPGAQLTAHSTALLLPEIEAGTLAVHLGPSLAGQAFVHDDTLGDTLTSFSARGEHGSLGIIKPDVAAPGSNISSAASGTGNGANALSGTSMSAPHVAGIAALVRGAHPTWTPSQVKAAVMNTATHDVYRDKGPGGPVYGPARVGSGRVDALDAVRTRVLAYATADTGLVSVTFGVVPVGGTTVVQRKTVSVQNTGRSAVTYATSFARATTAGGATITTSPASITVPAGGTGLVTLTLTANPATLSKDLDPTQNATYDLGGPIPRDFVAALSGRLVLTPRSGGELRVPVQAAPKLVSNLTAQPVVFANPGARTAPLTLTGRGVNAGGWTSLIAPMQLAATSPKLDDVLGIATSPSSVRAGDLRYVGFSSTAPQLKAAHLDPTGGSLAIGIATDGEWANLGSAVLPVIDTDLDGDGSPDLQTVVQKFSPDVDITTAQTYSYATGELLDEVPVNSVFGDIDTTVFDNNVLVIPMTLANVGITPGVVPTFSVWTYSLYAPDGSNVVDQVAPFSVDPYHPAYWFDGGVPNSLLFVGAPGTPVIVHRAATPGTAAPKLLVLHTHNATTTSRAQVVDVTGPTPRHTSTTLSVGGELRVGAELTLTARIAPDSASGAVRFLDGTRRLSSAAATKGVASVQVKLGAGKHTLTAVFVPVETTWATSASAPATVEIAR